jgi:hypothetical protein
VLLIVTDDPPEALIEEARQRQKQRHRRGTVILAAAALLTVVGFGIYQLAKGGNNVGATPPAAAAADKKPAPTVTYLKVEYRQIVPHLPTKTTTIETWSAPDGTTDRQVVTINGRRFEISATPRTDKVLGRERVNYLYDRSTGTIYQAGYELATPKPPPFEQQFKHVLGYKYTHLAGMTTYRGRRVYILRLDDDDAGVHGTTYVDAGNYRPLLQIETGPAAKNIGRTLAFKTLPATTANLALTSLTAQHPNAKIVHHGSPRISQLYGEAAFPPGLHS